MDQYPDLDVTIDGADEWVQGYTGEGGGAESRVDDELNSIKGGGACQLREKVLAEAAKVWVMVADYRKNSKVLGTTVCQVPSSCCVPIYSADL